MANRILLHLEKKDFTGGDTVEGELELRIDTTIPVRGVRVLFHGLEQSHWSRGSGRIQTAGSGRRRATFSEALDLFKQEITLFGDPQLEAAALISDSVKGLFKSEHYHTLEPGQYRYPFSFALPEHLPGDYEDGSRRSKIHYYIKGYLDIPLNIDVAETVPLTIYEHYDGGELHPEPISNYRTFVLESATAYNAKVTLDQNVYFPGDTVSCEVWIENRSEKQVHAIEISLQKKEALRAQGSSTMNVEVVHRKKYDDSGVPPGQTKEFKLEFPIPRNLYPTIVSSKLVQVEYQIVASLLIPWAIDHEIELPIVLLEEADRPSGTASAEPSS